MAFLCALLRDFETFRGFFQSRQLLLLLKTLLANRKFSKFLEWIVFGLRT